MKEWIYWGQWNRPALSISFWQGWVSKDFLEHMGLPELTGDIMQLDGHHLLPADENTIVYNASKKAAKTHDEDFFNKFTQWFNVIVDETFKAIKKIENSKDDDLLKITESFVKSFRRIITPWTCIFPISNAVEDIIKKRSENEGFEMNQILSLVEIPEDTLITKQKKEAKRLLKQIKGSLGEITDVKEMIKQLKEKDPELYDKLQKHVFEFEWVGTHHFVGQKLTAERAIEEAMNDKEFKHVKSDIKLSEELKWLIKLSGRFAYERLFMAEMSDILAFKVEHLFERINERFGLNKGEYVHLTFNEILHYLRTGEKPDIDIEQRKKGMGNMIEDGKEKIIVGKELKDIIDKYVPKKKTDVQEFKGTVASKGKARGKVRLLISPEDAYEFKEGEVLVAPETTPDFVPAMEKAVAIVTDRGGLTSHAAIVSRELGKPCVIGTSIGTSALKNGDMVEVDAEEGIVRKI